MSDVENLQGQIKSMAAQLDATKQMFNEAMASNLQLRTNINLLNQMHQESTVNKE